MTVQFFSSYITDDDIGKAVKNCHPRIYSGDPERHTKMQNAGLPELERFRGKVVHRFSVRKRASKNLEQIIDSNELGFALGPVSGRVANAVFVLVCECLRDAVDGYDYGLGANARCGAVYAG